MLFLAYIRAVQSIMEPTVCIHQFRRPHASEISQVQERWAAAVEAAPQIGKRQLGRLLVVFLITSKGLFSAMPMSADERNIGTVKFHVVCPHRIRLRSEFEDADKP